MVVRHDWIHCNTGTSQFINDKHCSIVGVGCQLRWRCAVVEYSHSVWVLSLSRVINVGASEFLTAKREIEVLLLQF